MSADMIIALVLVAGSLVLALRGVRGRQLSRETTAWMIVAWVVVFGAVAFIFSRLGV